MFARGFGSHLPPHRTKNTWANGFKAVPQHNSVFVIRGCLFYARHTEKPDALATFSSFVFSSGILRLNNRKEIIADRGETRDFDSN